VVRGHALYFMAERRQFLIQVNVAAAVILPNPAAMLVLKNHLALLPAMRAPLRAVVWLAPQRLLTPLLAALFTHLLRGQPLTGRLAVLTGKRVSLFISGPDHELRFLVTANGLANGWGGHSGEPWDVRIRGSFDDFWLMATRTEDPDMLFFSRRLTIEGDTETGLILKNLLDALEYDWRAHVEAVIGPLAALLPARRDR